MKLYNEIKEKIDNKLWKNGTQLPTEHELAKQYQVSRHTVRNALWIGYTK
ncbi:MAG: GntR family transcriptional regulator [Tissierellaceae bacterium]|jgi:DNA-binding GntR family transcriptional regulator